MSFLTFWHYGVGIAIWGLVLWINLRMNPDHAKRVGQAPDVLVRLYHIIRTAIVMFLFLMILAKIVVIFKPHLSMNPSPRQTIDLLAIAIFWSVIFATRYPT